MKTVIKIFSILKISGCW